jgi:Flp pilus assembly protein protease CpaA
MLATTSIATPTLGRPRGFAVALGLLLAAPVLVSGRVASMPLPILGWAAAFLFLAVERDVHCQRIPNWLTFPTLAAAFGYATWIGGAGGALDALLGAGAAFALLALPHAAGALGAGDVKAAMALGALFGAGDVARIVLLAIGFGGAVALARLATQGGLGELGRRWLHSLAASLASRRLVYLPPAPDAAAARGIPFAVAIALAVDAHLWMEIAR